MSKHENGLYGNIVTDSTDAQGASYQTETLDIDLNYIELISIYNSVLDAREENTHVAYVEIILDKLLNTIEKQEAKFLARVKQEENTPFANAFEVTEKSQDKKPFFTNPDFVERFNNLDIED